MCWVWIPCFPWSSFFVYLLQQIGTCSLCVQLPHSKLLSTANCHSATFVIWWVLFTLWKFRCKLFLPGWNMITIIFFLKITIRLHLLAITLKCDKMLHNSSKTAWTMFFILSKESHSSTQAIVLLEKAELLCTVSKKKQQTWDQSWINSRLFAYILHHYHRSNLNQQASSWSQKNKTKQHTTDVSFLCMCVYCTSSFQCFSWLKCTSCCTPSSTLILICTVGARIENQQFKQFYINWVGVSGV